MQGDMGSIPGKGTKTPQAWGQPSLLKTGREASALEWLSLWATVARHNHRSHASHKKPSRYN